MQIQRGTGGGRDPGNGETIVATNKTVVADLEIEQKALIFAWLIREGTEAVTRIAEDEFTIGSGVDAKLQIGSDEIKPIHSSLYFVQGHFEINDHNSRGGTWVNDRSIRRQQLEDGDRIRIGSHTFLFRCFRRNGNG